MFFCRGLDRCVTKRLFFLFSRVRQTFVFVFVTFVKRCFSFRVRSQSNKTKKKEAKEGNIDFGGLAQAVAALKNLISQWSNRKLNEVMIPSMENKNDETIPYVDNYFWIFDVTVPVSAQNFNGHDPFYVSFLWPRSLG
jgi:hypothetical protein